MCLVELVNLAEHALKRNGNLLLNAGHGRGHAFLTAELVGGLLGFVDLFLAVGWRRVFLGLKLCHPRCLCRAAHFLLIFLVENIVEQEA